MRRAAAAAAAPDTPALQRLYTIKRRDERVPLSVCVGDAQARGGAARGGASGALRRARVQDVALYGCASHLPPGLLAELLPGARARGGATEPYRAAVLRRACATRRPRDGGAGASSCGAL